MTDPANLTNEEIEAALSEVQSRLREARVAGGKICELEGRKWRLRFEQKFREGRKG